MLGLGLLFLYFEALETHRKGTDLLLPVLNALCLFRLHLLIPRGMKQDITNLGSNLSAPQVQSAPVDGESTDILAFNTRYKRYSAISAKELATYN